mgnify:CR=1 FL=1
MLGRFYEDFEVGEVLETPGRTITEADLVNFAGVSGDFFSLHVDEEYAKKTMFGRRIAHGLLTLAVVSGFWAKMGLFEGTLVAFYGIDKLRFTKPVYIGDTIRARIEVVGKEEKGRYGLVTLKHEVYNQNGETVMVFDAKLLFKRRDEQKSPEKALS